MHQSSDWDWSVGAKHLEDKLSVIAKNSSPNASPVQLSVVSGKTAPCSLLPASYSSMGKNSLDLRE
ncbi:MAG: hypothetical protein HEQ24_03775 [Dolichospermum sp. BR01]|nr:hypothetical protein [Dolichospermum sp. BR01]